MDLRKLKEYRILDRNFYCRDTAEVAKSLLGKLLVKFSGGNTIVAGFIVETEAYYGADDPASHAFRGRTPRSSIMFGKPGIAYVYFCYGAHFMLNAVTEEDGTPGAVLIRSVATVMGIETMISGRKTGCITYLANGPGKLTRVFGIDLSDNGKDMTAPASDLGIFESKEALPSKKIYNSPRVGIKSGKDKRLRFLIKDIRQA